MIPPFNAAQYWEKRLRENFSLKGVGYISFGRQYNHWMYRLRRYIFLKKIKPHLLNFPLQSVLDIGCGTGFYIPVWEAAGASQISGMDITEVAVARLRTSYPQHEFIQGDISAAVPAFQGRQFDAISAMDVLFHITDDQSYQRAFDNICSLIRPGGHFVFTENCLRGAAQRITHQSSRSQNEVDNALSVAGFVVLERCPMFYFMNAPVDSTKRFHHFLWKMILRVGSFSELAGFIIGGLLFPLELIAIQLSKTSPSTEMIVCQKPYASSSIPASG